MKKRNRKRASAGFTLLEVLVAVLVFGLMISAFGTGIANVIQTNGNAERRLQAELDVTNVVEVLQAEGISAEKTNYKDYSQFDLYENSVLVVTVASDFNVSGDVIGYRVIVKSLSSDSDPWMKDISMTTYVRARG